MRVIDKFWRFGRPASRETLFYVFILLLIVGSAVTVDFQFSSLPGADGVARGGRPFLASAVALLLTGATTSVVAIIAKLIAAIDLPWFSQMHIDDFDRSLVFAGIFQLLGVFALIIHIGFFG